MALLEVKDLHITFHTEDATVRAVEGVDIDVNAGESVGLVGESGSGKSITTLAILRLLDVPPAEVQGSVVFDDQDLLTLPEPEIRDVRGGDIGMIFQDPMTSLNPVLRVGRQIAEVMELHLHMKPRAARERTLELLNLVGIPNPELRTDDYPHQLSGGMRQRIMIAMAISCAPKLILADEPTTALDVTIQAQILEVLRNLRNKLDTSLLLISHDLGVVAEMTDRIHVMYAGQIVEKADSDELFANPRMPYTLGLLRAIPGMEREDTERLVPIQGAPPDLATPRSACRFEQRCPYRRDICERKSPELIPIPRAKPDHEVRCWGMQDVTGGGWLVDLDWRQEVRDRRGLDQIRQEWAQGEVQDVMRPEGPKSDA